MWENKISLVDYFNNVYWNQISGLDAGNGLTVGRQFDKGIISDMYASGDSRVSGGGWAPMHQGLVNSYNTYSSVFDQKTQAAADFAKTQEEQRAKAESLQAQQALRIQAIQASGNALRSSLQILAQGQGNQQAPTASMSKKKRQTPSTRGATASLRLGSTGNASGSGSNLAV